MCGRFNIISDPLTQLIMEITGQIFPVETVYNVAPTETVNVLRNTEGGWSLTPMRWWLVPWWSDGPSNKYSMFNAKSETLTRSRAFSEAYEKRRCVIPASSYYEWQEDEQGQRVPYLIAPIGQNGSAFAGLWERWRDHEQLVESFTIVTMAAPTGMDSLHHRIPVHLSLSEISVWIDVNTSKTDLGQLMASQVRYPLAITPVSTFVNNARNKDPRCIEPLGETRIVSADMKI